MNDLYITADGESLTAAAALAEKLKLPLAAKQENLSDKNRLSLHVCKDGLSLCGDGISLFGDFSRMLSRLKPNNLNGELICKAAKIKSFGENPVAIDATAGLGEDSFLLAAIGFKVRLYEYNPIIAALLADALFRASKTPELREIAARMSLYEENSVNALANLDFSPDLILLDPMFPERQKSGLVKKKLQIIKQLEAPCADESELFYAAQKVNPKKIIIKRPAKGAFLADFKPNYSVFGKSIRYDCIVL